MKALFIFDMKYINYKNDYYTGGGLNYNKIKEYISYFQNIKMFTRCVKVDTINLNKVNIASGKNVEFITINTEGIIKLFTKDVYNKLYNEIKRADIVIIRLPSFLGIIAHKISQKLNKPYLIELVSCPLDTFWNYGNLKGKLIAPTIYHIIKSIIKQAKYVHYVSESFLQTRYPTSGISLSCSDVIITDFNEKNLENRIAKIKHKRDDKYIFGVVGSLNVNYKGHKICIKALSLLKDKISFELHFLGGGKKERWIRLAKKHKIEDKLFFDETLPAGQPVFEWLDNLDIHLMMSKAESHGRILVEAMSRASISIGSNVGGILELLKSNCIVDKRDYKNLANKILEIISDKELQIKVATDNFEKAKEFEKYKLDKKRHEFYSYFSMENKLNE